MRVYNPIKYGAIALAMCFLVLALSGCSRGNENDNQVTAVDRVSSQTSTSISSKHKLLDGREQAVYLDVSDEEITLWDSASAGQIIAVAKYAQAMPGAADALQDCDFADLDEDGSSDLTAYFSFADGTAARLTWFYVDGGFIYNAEFSTLPGDTSARGAE